MLLFDEEVLQFGLCLFHPFHVVSVYAVGEQGEDRFLSHPVSFLDGIQALFVLPEELIVSFRFVLQGLDAILRFLAGCLGRVDGLDDVSDRYGDYRNRSANGEDRLPEGGGGERDYRDSAPYGSGPFR